MKRNTIVLSVTLFLMAAFAWAGWAGWEYRRQAAERRLAMSDKVELTPAEPADGSSMEPDAPSPLINHPAPPFALDDLSGRRVSLESFRGKALLINFWATWCGPCKIETPWLVELRTQYAPRGFEILGVSTDELDTGDRQRLGEQKQEIARFAQQMHMPYPILVGGDALSKPYGGLDALPTSFYVDRAGKVVAVQLGLTSKSDIENNIRKALGAGR